MTYRAIFSGTHFSGSLVRDHDVRALASILVVLTNWGMAMPVCAADTDFTGTWSIDLRSKAERKRGVECGSASFSLTQVGNKVSGEHVFSTPGCSRLNEGGEGTVKGVVVGSTAVLVVTSGRNGGVVMGTATKEAGTLHWNTVEEIKPGETEGDSPLILDKGILTRESPRAK
ncbi:MAG: hypothetical protein H6R10_3181 [Rhodocyclaceae bacterium]|nr:hypothetical protein [Rhodocyclaceae bacterium]